jgi:hypothetical protein
MLCEQPLEPCNQQATVMYRKSHNRWFATVISLCVDCARFDGQSLVDAGYRQEEV